MVTDATNATILRAKYLDWCSAQIADRFLELTPDEIYELAHDAASDDGEADMGPESMAALSLLGGLPAAAADADDDEEGSTTTPVASALSRIVAGAGGAPADGTVLGSAYRALVEGVTEALTARMELPPYHEWAAAYRESPERFDAAMLGFWREGM